MSRIGILTFHSANNFGALLQAVSLQNTISEYNKNIDCELIDYEPEFIRKDYSISPFTSKHPKTILTNILRIPAKKKRNNLFQDFRQKNIRCTKPCQSQIEFERVCNSFDKIVVGSDQVWNYNLTENDMRYFVPGINKGVERFAYAASTGGADFSGKDSDEMVCLLKDFQKISVRENASKDAIKDRLDDKEIEVVLDPVFLTTREKWLEQAEKPINKDYILFFKMGYSRTADPALEYARKLSKQTGYELVMLWDQEMWFRYRDVKHVGAVGPAEFLRWIKDAKCVVTNSFHATAFSIIFNTPFYVETEIERKDRVLNILGLFDLNDYGLKKGVAKKNRIEMPMIHWTDVNKKLELERNISLRFIEKILIGK